MMDGVIKKSHAYFSFWLHTHGFSYKKPAVVPGKANKDAQEQWLKEYEKLKANLSEDEAICFTDGVHPTHNMKLTYGWIRRGERKELPTNSGRQRLNLSGAIDIISKKGLENTQLLRKIVSIGWPDDRQRNAQGS